MIPGAHVSAAGGVDKAPENASELGIPAFQMFTRNQNRWLSPPIKPEQAENFKTLCKQHKIEVTAAHTSYLINLCAQDSEKLNKSRNALLDEMERAALLQIDYLVVHPGSHLGAGENQGIKEIAASLDFAIAQFADFDGKILLENVAGQGTNIGYRFEHLRDLISASKFSERLGICLDTCHLYAAGYEFENRKKYENMMGDFNNVIGIDKLHLWHLNDSKLKFGVRVDRHDNIGKGNIGAEPFRFLMNDKRFENIAGILETPGDTKQYSEDLQTLSDLMTN